MTKTYLRDFIDEHIGPECGGEDTGGTTAPIFSRLDAVEKAVARIEAGANLVVRHTEFVVLPASHMGESLQYIVPTEGVITRVSVLGSAAGLYSLTLSHKRGSTNTAYPILLRDDLIAQTVIINIPVMSGDWFELTWEVAEGAGSSPIVNLATLSLQLPEKIYVVESANAGS